MGKSRAGVFIVVAIGGIGLLIYALFMVSQGNHWQERYNLNGDEPYDLSLFKVLLDSAVDGKSELSYTPISELEEDSAHKTLIYMGHNFFADSAEASDVYDFIARGNTVFIIAPHVSAYILETQDSLEYIGYAGFYEDNSVEVRLDGIDTTKLYKFEFRDEFGSADRYWPHFEDSLSIETNVTQLGSFDGSLSTERMDNFRQVSIGKGQLLIHTDPLLFTNLFIIEKNGFEYADKVIGYLPNQPIIWDHYHRFYREEEEQSSATKTPLRFVMEHPPLKYAWYTILISALLFVVFRSKRQQKIIPLIPRVENTSIAFAKSLGALLYQADSGRYLAMEQMKLFNNYIRRKFGVKRRKDNDGMAEEIAKKSKVPINLIETILRLERQIVFNPSSKMKDNVELYHKLKEYYKLAKK